MDLLQVLLGLVILEKMSGYIVITIILAIFFFAWLVCAVEKSTKGGKND